MHEVVHYINAYETQMSWYFFPYMEPLNYYSYVDLGKLYVMPVSSNPKPITY